VIVNVGGCGDALTAPDTVGRLDGFVTKTITAEPRQGNEPIRIAETDRGLLNSIGLANPGRDRFVTEVLPRLLELEVPIWVSVGGFSADEYAQTCELRVAEDVAVLELNLSCPNVDQAAESAAEIVAACRAATELPLYAKLSAAVPEVVETVLAVEKAGADGLSLVNTIRGLVLGPELEPVLGRGVGGYSGPALKPIALAAVYAARGATELPIVGMGGIWTGRDALEFLAVGATAVALGT